MNLEGLPYKLDRMAPEDVATVSDIDKVVFSLPWSSTAFSQEIRGNPLSTYVVLRYTPWEEIGHINPVLNSMRRLIKPSHDASIVGYGGYWRLLEEAHICTLALRQEWRGRGLGELVLLALLEDALKEGAELATLEVRVSNAVAQNLYTKYAFQVTGRRTRYYSDNDEDALIMSTASMTPQAYRRHINQLSTKLRERLLAQTHEPPTTIHSEAGS